MSKIFAREQRSPFAPTPLQSLHHYYGLLRPCAPLRQPPSMRAPTGSRCPSSSDPTTSPVQMPAKGWCGRWERCRRRYRPHRWRPSAGTEPRSRWRNWILASTRTMRTVRTVAPLCFLAWNGSGWWRHGLCGSAPAPRAPARSRAPRRFEAVPVHIVRTAVKEDTAAAFGSASIYALHHLVAVAAIGRLREVQVYVRPFNRAAPWRS
jgi:hypothetical protein